MLEELASPLERAFLDLAEAVSSTIEPMATDGISWYAALELLVGREAAYEFEEAEANFTLVHDEVLENCDFAFMVKRREKLTQYLDTMVGIISNAARQSSGEVNAEMLEVVNSNAVYVQEHALSIQTKMREVTQVSVLLQRHFGMLTPWSVRKFSTRSRERQHSYREPLLAAAAARNVMLEHPTMATLDAYLETVPAVVDALLTEEIIGDSKEADFRRSLESVAADLQVAILLEDVN